MRAGAGWPGLLILLLALACSPPAAAQSESLQAAAKLTGLTTGMAAACRFETKPVLHAFRDLMDRKHVQGKERQRLVRLVSRSHDRAFATQHQPGAMSCPEVRDQVRDTIRHLQRAK
jgi:hypothetical protein